MPLTRLAAVAALAVLAVPAPATADPVPTPVAYAAGGEQRGGTAYVVTHSAGGGGTCLALIADGTGAYPAPVRHDSARDLVVRIARAGKPAAVTATAWRSAAAERAGLGAAVPVRLRPVRTGTKVVAWEALFAVPAGDAHVHFDVRWPDGPCGADQGSWRFRVLALPTA